MAGVIPKDKLTGYQRWDIGALDRAAATGLTPAANLGDQAPRPAMTSPLPDAPIAPIPSAAEDLQRSHEAARAEGYSQGFLEGQKAGEQAMATTVAETAAQFAELLGNLHISLAHLDQHVADQLLAVALEVATQVLRTAISTRPDYLIPLIREAMAALPLHHAHVVLRMHPADATVIREQIGEQLSQTGTQIIDDPAISPGGCQLSAGASEVDATIETRWKRVIESIGATPTAWLNPS